MHNSIAKEIQIWEEGRAEKQNKVLIILSIVNVYENIFFVRIMGIDLKCRLKKGFKN